MFPTAHRLTRALPVLALLVATFAAVPAAAQELKIGIIDTERVLLQSETGKAALAQLRELQQQKQAEIAAVQKEAEELRTRISEGRLSLAEETLADLQQQLEEKGITLRRMQDDAGRELNKRRDEVLAEVDRKVMPIIQQVGKEQGYSMLFRKFESGLIYADESVDITAEIITRVDAAQPAGN